LDPHGLKEETLKFYTSIFKHRLMPDMWQSLIDFPFSDLRVNENFQNAILALSQPCGLKFI